jgi:nucleoid-associated protein YgaU
MRYLLYTVQPEDRVRGLRGLALWFYGVADLWVSLYEHNRAVIGTDPVALTAGQQLIIPCEPPALSHGSALQITVYEVQPNDYRHGLAGIALHHYGDARHADAIYRVNRGTIGENANMLQAGQRLIIP